MSARADLVRALAALSEPPDPGHAPIARALALPEAPEPGDYAQVFLFGAYPYASVYLGPDGMLGGEARDRVAGFWRALGLVPPAEPDHVASLVGLYATLVDAEDDARRRGEAVGASRWRIARSALLWEHLLSWLPAYLEEVAALGSPYFTTWARMLLDTLLEEAREVGPSADVPLALRQADPLPAPEESAEAWVQALLSAVRSGIVLTRADLGAGARRIGIGSRVGDRAFMLRSMLEQDGVATAHWLAGEARRWAACHRAREAVLGQVAAFWAARARATESALVALEAPGADEALVARSARR